VRWLIDGYNLMHAAGLLEARPVPKGLRAVRHRFLNDLAAGLDPIDAAQTTVVFDAADPPADRPATAKHKGLAVVFAVGNENADERLEQLIAADSAPKGLTVVSSDRRVRQAAERRRAAVLSSADFLDRLDARRRARRKPPIPAVRAPTPAPSPTAEAAYWMEQFGAIEADPQIAAGLAGVSEFLDQSELEAIEREVERELAADPDAAIRRRPRR